MICTVCGKTMDPGARFCSQCGATVNFQTMNATQGRLVRPRLGRMIAGVCAGFAQRYGWDVTLVRVALVLIVLLGAGSPILAYLVAWIVMPNEPYMLTAAVAAPQPPPTQTGTTTS